MVVIILKKTAFLYANFFGQMALLVPYKVVKFAAAHLEFYEPKLCAG